MMSSQYAPSVGSAIISRGIPKMLPPLMLDESVDTYLKQMAISKSRSTDNAYSESQSEHYDE